MTQKTKGFLAALCLMVCTLMVGINMANNTDEAVFCTGAIFGFGVVGFLHLALK